MACNELIYNGIEYSREEFARLLSNGTIVIPSENVITEDFEDLNTSLVNYSLESVKISQTNKTQQEWKKFKKGNITFEQFLNSSQFPKEQKVLLKEVYNNQDSLDELMIDLTSKYSYTVEVNIAQTRSVKDNDNFRVNDDLFYTDYNQYNEQLTYYKNDEIISKKEYLEAANFTVPTDYYSNLTVPGGTNYIEVEIATPNITPSIRGHAQFSTDQGIGWFRSDDKYYTDSYSLPENTVIDENTLPFEIEGSVFNKGKATTRRLLELQSDLFQKGRDKQNLAGFKSDLNSQEEDLFNRHLLATGQITQEEFDNPKIIPSLNKENQFLQLLNKDGNWIPFFIKTFIQDSTKKGYEKVLFPTGNTASRIEGHNTLEEFKKQKEARIKELQSNKDLIEKGIMPNYEIDEDGAFIEVDDKNITNIDIEIKTLQEELKRVETEGFGALKPIYNFYENRVYRELEKIYTKEGISRIKDEYNNEWFEVELNPAVDLNEIYLDLNTNSVNSTNTLIPFKFSVDRIKTGEKTIVVKPNQFKRGSYRLDDNKTLVNIIPIGKGLLSEYLSVSGLTAKQFKDKYFNEKELEYTYVRKFLADELPLFIYEIKKVETIEDVIPDIDDDRYIGLYENRVKIIKSIKQQLKRERNSDKKQILRDRIKYLENQLELLKDEDSRSIALVMSFMESDIKAAVAVLDNNPDEKSMSFVRGLVTNYTALVGEGFKDALDTIDEATKNKIIRFISESTEIIKRLNKQVLAIADAEVKAATGISVLDVNGVPIVVKDYSNLGATWTYTTNQNINPIVQTLTKAIRDADVKVNVRLNDFKVTNERLIKELKAAGYNYEFMVQLDSKGNKTGNFVARTSAEYDKARFEATDKLTFWALNNDFKVNQEAWEQKKQNLTEWFNNTLRDTIVLSDYDISNNITIEEKRDRVLTSMIDNVNPNNMLRIVEKIKKNPKFVDLADREFYNDFISKGGLKPTLLDKEWVKSLEVNVNDKWIDPRWKAIQKMDKNDVRKRFYNHFVKHINQGRNLLKNEEFHLVWNVIPEKAAPIGIMSKIRQWRYDNLGQRVNANSAYVDEETGEIVKSIPLFMTGDNLSPENKSYNLGVVLQDFMKDVLNYEEKSKVEDKVNLLLHLIKEQKVYEQNADGTPKLDDKGKIIEKQVDSNNYTQAAYRVAASLYGQTQDIEGVTNKKVYNAEDQKRMKSIEKTIKELNLTEAEKKLAVQYSSQDLEYVGNNPKIMTYVKLTKEYRDIKSGGRNITGNKIVNTMLYMTSLKYLGLNLFGGVAELLQGTAALMTEGASKTYFNDGQAASGIGAMMSTLTPWSTPQKTLVTTIVKTFDSIGNIFQESEKKLESKMGELAFAQYKAANFITNGAFTVSMLKATKIKDKAGIEHNLFDIMTVNAEGKLALTIDSENQFYDEKGLPTQFLIDLIQKSDSILFLNRERKTFMDPTKIDSKAATRIIGQFKKGWLPQMFYMRFGDKRGVDLFSGKEFEGFYRSFYKQIFNLDKRINPITGQEEVEWSVKNFLKPIPNLIKYLYRFSVIGRITGADKSGYSELEIANLRKMMRELSIIGSLYVTMLLLTSMMSDGDDDDYLITMFINQFMRLQRDLSVFLNPISTISIAKNPAPVLGSMVDYFKIITAVHQSLILGDPYNRDGDLRVVKAIEKNIPYVNQVDRTYDKFLRITRYNGY